MSVDDAVNEVRRLIWVADLDHRQVAAIEVVCAALAASRAASVSKEEPDHALTAE
ncbi:MAG: hypothetical protein AB7L17_11205 [Ilumatobacteraceae bacterium]